MVDPIPAPFNIPDLPSADDILPYLHRMDAARWYSNFGPFVCELEEQLTAHLTSITPTPSTDPIALTTLTSCYAALALGLQVMRLPPQAKVLIPSITFPACPLAVIQSGAKPVFADIDPHQWTLTPAIARRIAAHHKIDAVMPVALYGIPVPTDGWDDFTRETGIPVIIDAAAAFGVQPIPQHCLVAFSFHATKPFGIGEGGLLVGRNAAQIQEARLLSNFGTRDRLTLHNGCNAKMSEYHGAVGLAQLQRWPGVKKRRRNVFDHYRRAMDAHPIAATRQPDAEQGLSSFMIRLENTNAIAVKDQLCLSGISAHRTYLPPLYRHPLFETVMCIDAQGKGSPPDIDAKATGMVGAEAISDSVLGLPFHAFISPHESQNTIDTLSQILSHDDGAQPLRAKAAGL